MCPLDLGFPMLVLLTVAPLECGAIDYFRTKEHCMRTGWFGQGCKFRCHCKSPGESCNLMNGACWNGCSNAWFGPLCQYAASPYTVNPPSYNWLNGSNGIICGTKLPDKIELILQIPHVFTWMRGNMRTSDNYTEPTVKLFPEEGRGDNPVRCRQVFVRNLENRNFDVYCQSNVIVSRISLSGPLLKSLCSIYISAGRNVALRQDTHLKYTRREWTSDLAVDGHVKPEKPGITVCTASEGHTALAIFTLTLAIPAKLSMIVLHSGNEKAEKALAQGFKMVLYHNSSQIYTYQSAATEVTTDKYIIVPKPPLKMDVSKVVLSGLGASKVLTFCELEVFGETRCDDGKFGIDCAFSCHCAKGPCHVATGHCLHPGGCQAGFRGDKCAVECLDSAYGEGCSQRCNKTCPENRCHPVTGECLAGLPSQSRTGTSSASTYMIFVMALLIIAACSAATALVIQMDDVDGSKSVEHKATATDASTATDNRRQGLSIFESSLSHGQIEAVAPKRGLDYGRFSQYQETKFSDEKLREFVQMNLSTKEQDSASQTVSSFNRFTSIVNSSPSSIRSSVV